uniref:Ankyrin repeat-containing protein n=1 Tax=Tanacetum cinerariifolium TaxID=118510 RepID=A0A6L2P1Y2_TANCI|nr:ankyrin repeat-containing protein [Tanacetum cinerariifolium]
MACSSSNIPPDASRYLYASNANVCNFVSVKLSGRHNYHLWKAQMLCLMESHNMRGIVDDTFSGPLILDIETHKQYDSLLKGWIFGSIGEEVLRGVYNLCSAKDVWKELNATYDTTSPNPIAMADR